MKVLAIGGTGFIGRFVAATLQRQGHAVTVFHRGTSVVPPATGQIIGNRDQLGDYQEMFARENFDVVIHFILSSERQAKQFMETLRGLTRRVVALSSMDVYRAWGIFYGFESSGLEKMPVTEESELRATRNTYPPETLKKVQAIYPWIDDEYDKIPVEQVVLGERELPGTVLRLPMIYGPGDPLHRFHTVLKRIDDGRPHILFADDVAALRTPRGYVENVAAGIALAAISERAAGRVYNICEQPAFSELEWAKKIGSHPSVAWQGKFVVLPHNHSPAHLLLPANTAQHLVVSSERIRTELGYKEPVGIEEAISRTVAWERANQPEGPVPRSLYEGEDEALEKWKATA